MGRWRAGVTQRHDVVVRLRLLAGDLSQRGHGLTVADMVMKSRAHQGSK
jgi:hypothetical protein